VGIQAVAIANNTGSTMSLPTHRKGDLIYLAAVGQTTPVASSGFGWSLLAAIGTGSFFLNLYQKEAFSKDNEACGTFTNAYALIAITYRSIDNERAYGLAGNNWGSRAQNTADYRIPIFQPINRQNEINSTSYSPMMRVNAVAINSTSADLNANLPAGWNIRNNFTVASPTPTRVAFLDSYYTGGAFNSFDVVHGAGVVGNRSIGTACYETNYLTQVSAPYLSGYIGNGTGVF
jgi:hypothetical protein